MRPTVEEQLSGVCDVLARVVVPAVDDPYVADILQGSLQALRDVADRWSDAHAFMEWDCAATSEVLRMAGVEPPPAPEDPLGLAGLSGYQETLRQLLEAQIGTIREDPLVEEALVRLMRERCARFPFSPYAQRGQGAAAAQ